MESHIGKSECAATHKKKLTLFLLLTGLIKVSEPRLFGRGDLFVWVCLVIEFECIISVREFLLRLFFDFSVGLNPIQKLGAVVHVFGHSGLISFKGIIVSRFLCQHGLPAVTRRISGKIVVAGKSIVWRRQRDFVWPQNQSPR